MEAVLVDYGSGNLHSAKKALERAGQEAGLTVTVTQTDNPQAVKRADRIILPGVGAFADCRKGLEAHEGLVDALEEAARSKPLLGICVGMQLMASRGLEHGIHDGFGWIPGDVAHLDPSGHGTFKLPHMGWNALDLAPGDHPVLSDLPGQEPHVYFVHSYAFRAQTPDHVLATSDYGGTFTAVIGRDNLVGTQFHPEKSQAVGLKLLANFLAWAP